MYLLLYNIVVYVLLLYEKSSHSSVCVSERERAKIDRQPDRQRRN